LTGSFNFGGSHETEDTDFRAMGRLGSDPAVVVSGLALGSAERFHAPGNQSPSDCLTD